MNNSDKQVQKIRNLINTLNGASNSYYNGIPIMEDIVWDNLYELLKAEERESGIIFPDSPTQNVGYQVVDTIKKVKLDIPMLSLDKCHTNEELIKFADNKDCILSVKCDGLSTRLHYSEGKLIGAYTRGTGIEGGDVLHNVMTIKNIPQKIPYHGELIVDGETIIDWEAFKTINDNLPAGQEKYKHPRNLVSGSLNLLDSKIAAQRNMRFIVWRVIKGSTKSNTMLESYIKIKKLGFEVVPYLTYENKSDIKYLSEMLNTLKTQADKNNIPYDGVVMSYNDIEYGMSLGRTTKFFRHSIAYKFEDQEYRTVLKDIIYSMGKTGQLTPVAIFEPVEIDGTTVERASLHNVSILTELDLQVGDMITVYKANQIIPQIKENISAKGRESTYIKIPSYCPICGAITEIRKDSNTVVLYCTNNDCGGKLLGRLSHAVSKEALNIDGLSEATLEKFIKNGWLNSISDIYELKNYYNKLTVMPGFGIKSVNKLLQAIEDSKNTTLDRFIYAHSIPLIGKTASRLITQDCNYNYRVFVDKLNVKKSEAFTHIDGFGSEMGQQLYVWYENNADNINQNAQLFTFEVPEQDKNMSDKLKGKVFCITGSLNLYNNRKELKQALEKSGAKVVNSISTKVTYLVNNDINSNSSKNKKSKELGIDIITEETVKNMIKN